MSGGGSVVTFELDGGKAEAFALLDALGRRHLEQPRRREVARHAPGDDDPPAADAGGPGRGRDHRRDVRLSVGLEDPLDLVEDVVTALAQLS